MEVNKQISKEVGIWIRVSTREQAEGDSPKHHEARARKYAEFKEWTVKEVYDLSGVSGKSVAQHPECKRMIKDIERGHISGLIFSKLARLARNTRELLDFCDLFRSYDADLISLGESIDTSTPAGRLFYTLISANAQFERETIADRVKSSVPIRAELGKSLGGQAPYGYKWVNKKLTLDENEAPVRRLMFELFTQKKRKGTVCRILNQRGYRTRNGSKFSGTTLERLLSDPIAKGQRRVNYTQSLGEKKHWQLKPEEEWIYQDVPAIVDEKLWEAVQGVLVAQKKGAKPRRNPTHLFSGLIGCHCGHKMYVLTKTVKYTCTACRNKIPTADMELIFIEQLRKMVFNPKALDNLLSEVNSQITDKKKRLSSLQKEKTKLKAQLDQLLELQRMGELPMQGFKEHYKPIYEQYEQISERVPDLQQEIAESKRQEATGEKAILDTQIICEQWTSYSREEKKLIIETFIKQITIAERDLTISLNGLVVANDNENNTPSLSGSSPKSHARVPMRLFQSSF